jgi:hypothetical protein
MPDNYDLWEAHQREQDKLLERLPKCADCGEPIQDDDYYEFDCYFYCWDCVCDNHRKSIDAYVGD